MSSPGPPTTPNAAVSADNDQVQNLVDMDEGQGRAPDGEARDQKMPENSESPLSEEIPRSKSPENLIDFDGPAAAPDQATELAVADTQPSNGAADEPPDIMTSSAATIKPTTQHIHSTASGGLLGVKPAGLCVDPTANTPTSSQSLSRTTSSASRHGHARSTSEVSPTRSDAAYDERRYLSEDEQEPGSGLEIQSIMAQFSGDGGGPGEEEVMSPRLEITSPLFGGTAPHPPRKSSLEPVMVGQFQEYRNSKESRAGGDSSKKRMSDDSGPPVPPKDNPPVPPRDDHSHGSADPPMSPLHMPPPPEPEPEPALQFDFHRFLEQLRNKKADPVARYLKSFLQEFGKRQWMVHEQVKIVGDFLAFIANKMALCEVWRTVSDPEFDNAREGMEKLVMNRLYTQTFSPAISPPQPIPGAKPKRRGGDRPMGPGRRGQHQEDVERDEILTQKINIYGWIRDDHLDIPPVGDNGRRFLKLAQQGISRPESLRARTY